MIPQSYNYSHDLCLNNFLQLWLIGNQRYQVTLFRYTNWDDDMFRFIIQKKLLQDMKYLMRPFKQAAEAVGIWTKYDWDMNRVN